MREQSTVIMSGDEFTGGFYQLEKKGRKDQG